MAARTRSPRPASPDALARSSRKAPIRLIEAVRNRNPAPRITARLAPRPDKAAGYRELAEQLAALVAGEPDVIANCANLAALLYHGLPDLNWAGFYFLRGEELVLGPFQGRPACVRIPLGRGVCGTAAARREPVVVPDVHAFPGHIACDPVSRSELVVPLIEAGRVLGVLDLDSPRLARFDDGDRDGCAELLHILLSHQRRFPGSIER